MKVSLIYKDRDFNVQYEPTDISENMLQDLGLDILFEAMARNDDFILDVVRNVILSYKTNDKETILYRQKILKDCVKNNDIVREIYNIAVESIENRRKHHFGIFTTTPSSILGGAISLLQMFIKELKKLRKIADTNANMFVSEGFKQFFGIIKLEISDQFLTSAERLLKELKFENGILIKANLSKGNEGSNYTLIRRKKQRWLNNIISTLSTNNHSFFSFKLHPRDISGFSTLANIKNRAINPVSNILAQSAEHVLSFFEKLKRELAFYIGALNFYDSLKELGEPIAFPTITDKPCLSFKGLYDPCLSLKMHKRVVGNNLKANRCKMIIITGANHGGKSTFLRSIGIAQLLLQSGMFVPAEEFTSNLCSGIFTHFKKEEDKQMKSGRLDEELERMSKIADNLAPGAMMLLNESFSSTNEREGSEIARQVTTALTEAGIKVLFVTHLYEFASNLYNRKKDDIMFLVAERKEDGTRTFRIVEGKPSSTAYGEELYERVFVNNRMPPNNNLPY